MGQKFEAYLKRAKHQHGERFSPVGLADQFKPYFESGDRIEVEFSYGERKRGRVGVTGGWQPSFMLLLRQDSIGSSWLLGQGEKVVKVVAVRRREVV